ncbi:MAG: heparinase II/III family protein [Kiritimatiellae bacterium]|nr:heparinase II/III family protein [Kiritimatiellia bacterium]
MTSCATQSLLAFLASAVAVVAAHADARLAQEFSVNGGDFYNLEISASLDPADATNEQAIGVARIEFGNRHRRLTPKGSLVSGVSPDDACKGLEYLFPDTAACICGTNRWSFQFRAPDEAEKVSLEVVPWKNLADVDFSGMKLRGVHPARHEAWDAERTLHPEYFDNEIDITGRTSLPTAMRISLRNANAKKPFFATNAFSTATNEFHLALPLPSPCAREVIIKAQINRKRSTAEFMGIKAISRFEPIVLPEKDRQTWFQIPTRMADSLSISGNLVASGTSGRNAKSGLMQIDPLDANGKSLTLQDMPRSKKYGNYSYLHSGSAATNGDFKVTIPLPQSARTLRLGFSKWAIPNTQTLSGLKVDFSNARFSLSDLVKAMKQGDIDGKPLEPGLVLRHFRNLYKQDGFIRDQSTAYHHASIGHLLDFHRHFIDSKTEDAACIRKIELLLEKALRADAATCLPDEGQFMPIGDTWNAHQRQELRQYVESFGKYATKPREIPVEFGDMQQVTTLADSGLYVFRNTEAGRMLVVDISPNKAAHGHYDCGSYHYFSDGVRWIGDRGGPYRQATRQHRELMSSASHSVAGPAAACQMAGIAYDVELQEHKAGYIFSFWTNAYGPEYRHRREFIIERDLSSFSVEDTFSGPGDASYASRMILGQGVDVEIADASGRAAVIKSGEAALRIRSSHGMHAIESTASFAEDVFTPVKVLEASGRPGKDGEMRFQHIIETTANPKLTPAS